MYGECPGVIGQAKSRRGRRRFLDGPGRERISIRHNILSPSKRSVNIPPPAGVWFLTDRKNK